MAFVIWFFGWTVSANSGFENWGDMDYYALPVRSWKKGHLHLDKDPLPELLELADPYDPAHNDPYRMGVGARFEGGQWSADRRAATNAVSSTRSPITVVLNWASALRQ